MSRVIRGAGIKFLDEQFETAAFKTLIGVYSHLVFIQNTYDLEEVLFVFWGYLYNEYQRLYSFLKTTSQHGDACKAIEDRLKSLKPPVGNNFFITPSEILNDLDRIKAFKKLIQVHQVSVPCFPCKKLK